LAEVSMAYLNPAGRSSLQARGHVVLAGVEGVSGAQFQRQVEALLMDVDGHERIGSGDLGGHDGAEPHRARSEHHQIVLGSDGEGVDDRTRAGHDAAGHGGADLGGDIVHFDQTADRGD
jgi:hypothetical protein